jgi:hypothetical protein
MIDVAARIDDFEPPPGNRLKALRGEMSGRHSIRVNEPYRVTFRWENGHAIEVAVEDDAFASDPDRLRRFTRDAQTLAALNHPIPQRSTGSKKVRLFASVAQRAWSG